MMFSQNELLKPRQILRAIQATARVFPSSGAPAIQRVDGGPFAPVSACTAPANTAQDHECYCTTNTCGAGLLDTGLAVAAPPMVAAGINVGSLNVAGGSSTVLDASGSGASGTSSIVDYQWAITGGADLSSLSRPTNAATVTLATKAAGSVTVSLTVKDSAGQSDTTTTTLTVSAPPVVTPPSTSSGGGAMELGWLLGWLASVIGVWVVTPRPGRQAA